jgi:hypothetical protein
MQYRKLVDLKELVGNPREISHKDFAVLCKSISDNPKYFEARPIILSNRTGELVIIAGNMRYKAAVKLDLKKVPTFLIEGLTERKEQEITIRDNVSNGEWDFDALANAWSDLPLSEWGIKVPGVFSAEEIEPPGLSSEDREKFREITFIVHDKQYEVIEEAIKKAKEAGGSKSKLNENGNGNALAFICKKYSDG